MGTLGTARVLDLPFAPWNVAKLRNFTWRPKRFLHRMSAEAKEAFDCKNHEDPWKPCREMMMKMTKVKMMLF